MYGMVVIDYEEDYKPRQVVHAHARHDLSIDWVIITTKNGDIHLYAKRLVTGIHYHPDSTNKTE